ncbi:hypothetical protein HY971_03630 [Candidatus Kaiserbacteria bacterium]|nr:hypothetical protein [Candidatus Kaiserbacteria bacterium]
MGKTRKRTRVARAASVERYRQIGQLLAEERGASPNVDPLEEFRKFVDFVRSTPAHSLTQALELPKGALKRPLKVYPVLDEKGKPIKLKTLSRAFECFSSHKSKSKKKRRKFPRTALQRRMQSGDI